LRPAPLLAGTPKNCALLCSPLPVSFTGFTSFALSHGTFRHRPLRSFLCALALIRVATTRLSFHPLSASLNRPGSWTAAEGFFTSSFSLRVSSPAVPGVHPPRVVLPMRHAPARSPPPQPGTRACPRPKRKGAPSALCRPAPRQKPTVQKGCTGASRAPGAGGLWVEAPLPPPRQPLLQRAPPRAFGPAPCPVPWSPCPPAWAHSLTTPQAPQRL